MPHPLDICERALRAFLAQQPRDAPAFVGARIHDCAVSGDYVIYADFSPGPEFGWRIPREDILANPPIIDLQREIRSIYDRLFEDHVINFDLTFAAAQIDQARRLGAPASTVADLTYRYRQREEHARRHHRTRSRRHDDMIDAFAYAVRPPTAPPASESTNTVPPPPSRSSVLNDCIELMRQLFSNPSQFPSFNGEPLTATAIRARHRSVNLPASPRAGDRYTVVNLSDEQLTVNLPDWDSVWNESRAEMLAAQREINDRMSHAMQHMMVYGRGAIQTEFRDGDQIEVQVQPARGTIRLQNIHDPMQFVVFGLDAAGGIGDVGTPEAQERGLKLLKEWLSPEQRAQYEKERYFEVVGSDTGKRYRIHHGRQMNIHRLNARGRPAVGFCFLPEGQLVAGDVMLAQKLALETREKEALKVANKFEVAATLEDLEELAQDVMPGVREIYCGYPTRWHGIPVRLTDRVIADDPGV